ncbi:MAG: PH domain-containing protein [Alphaproteobacteria bacterium]|nr:PH domain-containing protein [Alphaproteobacteria bacterium]
MAFIDRVVGPDEELIGILSVHWIYGLKGLMWLLGFSLFGLFLESQADIFVRGYRSYAGPRMIETFGDASFWICVVIGAFLCLFYMLMMLATELGLTSKRVICKRGLIFVDVKELDIEEIKAADVNNGILGRFLNYGYIVLDARFVQNVELPAISNPYGFLRVLNNMRSRLKEDSVTIVLDGEGSAHNKNIMRSKEVKETKEELKTSRTIEFKRDMHRQKEHLRRKIKSVFSRKSHEEGP